MAETKVTHRLAPSKDHFREDQDSENVLERVFSDRSSSPCLPYFPSTFTNPTFYNRKRDIDEGIGNSSDTPLFSSDDLPPSAENYFEHRQKRQRRGPWWDHADEGSLRVTRQKSKRMFKRNFDSGIWMGSDSSSESLDLMATEKTWSKESLRDLALRTTEEPHTFDGPVFPYWEDQPPDLEYFWQVHEEAHEYVETCMDQGGDTIDLSHAGLLRLPRATLAPLQYYLAESQISPSRGGSFCPDLKLFLANNQLARVPGQLLRLENLTVLSLRGNNLAEIPPGINSLINLRELNVGSNNLRWLPYEIRDLLDRQLRLFGFYPNPFIRPMPRFRYNDWVFERPLWSTKPTLLYSDGTLAYDSLPSPTITPTYWPPEGIQPTNDVAQDDVKRHSRVPSLFEICLRSLRDSPQLSQLPYLIPKDAPVSLLPALKHTWQVTEEGGQRCTICKTAFIVPRTEWLEWWQLSVKAEVQSPLLDSPAPNRNDDRIVIGSPVPLLRRGCSWACVPESALNQTGWGPARGLEVDEVTLSSPRKRIKT